MVLSEILLLTLLHMASVFLSIFGEFADFISPLVFLKMEFPGLLFHSPCFFGRISINRNGKIIFHGFKFILKVYTHFTDEESKAQRLNNLVNVTQLINGKNGFEPNQSDFKIYNLCPAILPHSHCFLHPISHLLC